jgi:cytochrome c oxidase subunit 2
MGWLPFWPVSGATSSAVVNRIFLAELAVCAAILALVFGLIWVFCIRYRRGSKVPRSGSTGRSWHVEIAWTTATLAAFLGLFVWGANAYVWLYQPPPAQLDIYIIGKQWMWHVQHPGGQREIDQLHVPVDTTVRLVLGSQDVIHSFYIPEFRVKHDVVPGTLQAMWFRATKTGTFRIECAEFCGTRHADMGGQVIVMQPAAYASWLADQGVAQSLAQQGEAAFRRHGCSGCHSTGSTVHAPSLIGLYGTTVHLADGSTRIANERYLRDAILLPKQQVVAGYAPVMPSFAGQLSEAEIMQLIAYIQSLKVPEGAR